MVERVEENQRGQAYPAINDKDFSLLPFPLPPLPEQHRIVAKVDELMALLDRLEITRTQRETTRDRLTTSSLTRLTAPETTEKEFRTHARFALDNLDQLTSRPEQIKTLRNTILDLAIRGKLTKQDAADEPAAKLVGRIEAESAKLVKARKNGKMNKTKPLMADELPFDIPSHWHPVKLSQTLHGIQTGPFRSSLHKSDYILGGIPVINPASIQDGQIIPIDKMAVGDTTLERLASFKLQSGDIVMARRGEMGRCARVTKKEGGWLCGTGSLILRPSKLMYPEFLVLLIGSPFSRQYLGGTAVGSTMQNLNQTILLNLPFGLPSVAEQHRIVAKVDALMVLCDRLEATLTSGVKVRGKLFGALLHESMIQISEKELAVP